MEQCDPACIIGVASPSPGKDASCTDNNLTRNVRFKLNAPIQSDQRQKGNVATHYASLGSAQNEATQTVLQIQPPSLLPQRRAKQFSSKFIEVSRGKFFCTVCREELSLKNTVFKTCV